jgi:mannitol/fructose-specific phosphotransferase system IIA component (Ntr-type)
VTMSIGASVLDPSLCISDLRNKRKPAIFQELVDRAHQARAIREPVVLCDTLLLRERLAPSAMGKGVAIPHARSMSVIEPRIVIARSRKGVDWSAPDDQLVHLLLLVLSPGEWSEESHLDLVTRAASAARLQRNRTRLIEATDFVAVAQVFGEP